MSAGNGNGVTAVQTPQQREEILTIYERSRPGRRAFTAPDVDVPELPIGELLPDRLRRIAPPELPEIAEPEIVRHYNGSRKRNFDLDSGFYPLGSCTMKHNPQAPRARRGPARATRACIPLQAPGAGPGRAGADVEPASARSPRSAGCLTSRCSRAPARTASSPACC